MTREEHERRKLQIEAERRAAIELIEAAHQAQLRALELVWLAGGDGLATAAALPPPPGLATVAAPHPAAVPAPAPPARRRRLAIGQLWNDVVVAIATLPDTFDTLDVVRALGYSPHRGSLLRTLAELEGEGEIKIVQLANGRQPTRYCKLPRRQDGAAGEPVAATS